MKYGLNQTFESKGKMSRVTERNRQTKYQNGVRTRQCATVQNKSAGKTH